VIWSHKYLTGIAVLQLLKYGITKKISNRISVLYSNLSDSALLKLY